MADPAMIQALNAIVNGMQNHQNAMAQQTQQQQQAMAAQQAAIAAQQTAQQIQHAQLLLQLQNQQNQQGPRPATLLTIPNFSGGPSDNFADCEAAIERATVADNWNLEMKRRMAISKLTGLALSWQDGKTKPASLFWDGGLG